MSEIAISRPPSSAPSYRRNAAMNRTLLWKELRQLGVYAFAIMIPSLAFILLLPVMQMFEWHWNSPDSLFQAVRVIPLLVLLATAASTFSIEHENRSFQFLRSLPFSSGRIVATKMLVAAAYGLLAALIFWPIARLMGPSSPSESLLSELLTLSMAWGTVFLWAIYASLSCRTVLNSITKSMIGFILFFFVPENISLFDLDVEHDLFYWIFETVMKLASALFLIVMIAVKSRTWCKDREAWRPGPFKTLDRLFEIKTCSPVTWLSPLWRLVWLQRRTGLLIFTSMVPICLLLRMLFITVTPVENSYPPFFLSRIAFFLVICIGVMGSVVFSGIQPAKSMLIQQNYRPSLIWISQIAAPLFCCIIAGLSADFFVYGESPRLLYFTEWIVVGFSIGQLFSMLCRIYVVAISFTLFTLWTTFLFNNYLSGALNQYWLTWTFMICLPIVATFLHRRIWLYERPMSRALIAGLASVAMLALLQIPLYRIYEVPWVSQSEVLAKLPQGIDGDQSDLDRFRTLVRRLPWLDSTTLATDDECDLGEQILANAGGEILITGHNPTNQDFVSFHSTTRYLVNLILKPIRGSSDRYHRLKMNILESWPVSLRLGFYPFDSAIEFAQDERTTITDIQRLILALENEDCFDCYRYLIANDYRYLLENPENAGVNDGVRNRSEFESFLFWEKLRKRRVIHYFLAKVLSGVDELEKSHSRSETQEDWLIRKKSLFPSKYHALMKRYPRFKFAWGENYFFRHLREQRATKVGLAIVAWQKENDGEYPDTLDQLVGKYLKRIPKSPMNGTPFYFSPNGLSNEHIMPDGPTRPLHNLGKDTHGISRAANQPFLWLNEWRTEEMPSVERLPAISAVDDLKSKDRTNERNYILFYVIPNIKKRQETAK